MKNYAVLLDFKYSLAFLLQGSNVKGKKNLWDGGWGRYVSKCKVQRNTNFRVIHIRKATCFNITVWQKTQQLHF